MSDVETESHFRHSSLREKIVEHLFVGELLKAFWRRKVFDVEIARPEIDNAGTDLIIARGQIVGHVQLKSSYLGAMTSRQTLNVALAEKPSGCVVWIVFDQETLAPVHYLWLGGAPGSSLAEIEGYPTAKHTKGDSHGKKVERPNMRIVTKTKFDAIDSIDGVIEKLLGV